MFFVTYDMGNLCYFPSFFLFFSMQLGLDDVVGRDVVEPGHAGAAHGRRLHGYPELKTRFRLFFKK